MEKYRDINDTEKEISYLIGGLEFKDFNLTESTAFAKKALDIIAKRSSQYFKVFLNLYWNSSLTNKQKIYNIQALLKQLELDPSLSEQIKGDDYEFITYFLKLLKRRKKLRLSIQYGQLMFN